MQRVQLDISNDIFDKVIFFLENLPKNKIKLNFEKVLNTNKHSKKETFSLFDDFLNESQEVNSIQKIEREILHER